MARSKGGNGGDESSDDVNVEASDPTTGGGVGATAESTIESTTGEPVVVAQPVRAETVKPQRYSAGDTSERAVYGVRNSDGTVRITGDQPGEGERGVLVVAEGDTITAAQAAQLNAQSGSE